jgi:hypothetical protein
MYKMNIFAVEHTLLMTVDGWNYTWYDNRDKTSYNDLSPNILHNKLNAGMDQKLHWLNLIDI